MWNYCGYCGSQWFSRKPVLECDICHTPDPLQSEQAKVGE